MAQNITASIPSIDISSFLGPKNPSIQQQISKELAAACRTNGCVGIVGHGVDRELLRQAFDIARDLFELPYETKMRARRPDAPNHHRGYFGPGREQVSRKTSQEAKSEFLEQTVAESSDLYEGYQIGDEENVDEHNIWLPEDAFPGFRDFMIAFFSRLRRAAEAILEALIMSLNMTQDEAICIQNLHRPRFSQLRLAYYPPVCTTDQSKSTASRINSHTDFSSFTLLFQDSVGGLEFEDRNTGAFMPAIPKEGLLYMNIGDVFSRISNGLYPSAMHRVSVPLAPIHDKTKTIPARYSIPFFVAPDPHGLIEPQPTLVTARGFSQFAPIIFEDYANQLLGLIEAETEETTAQAAKK